MRTVNIPVNYYDQTSADMTLPVPGHGYGGWKRSALDFDLDTTAVVVMHSVYAGSPEDYPGVYRSCEYVPRSEEIDRYVFPPLLAAVRASGIKVYHIGFTPRPFYKRYDGYVTEGLDFSYSRITVSDVTRAVFQFKNDYNWPGKHNLSDRARSDEIMDFLPHSKPAPGEPIFENTNQLFDRCVRDEIDHLVYIGFCINACIQSSACGMTDMQRRGFLCTTIREATTAVENKETAAGELSKERALTGVGLIFSLGDFIGALPAVTA